MIFTSQKCGPNWICEAVVAYSITYRPALTWEHLILLMKKSTNGLFYSHGTQPNNILHYSENVNKHLGMSDGSPVFFSCFFSPTHPTHTGGIWMCMCVCVCVCVCARVCVLTVRCLSGCELNFNHVVARGHSFLDFVAPNLSKIVRNFANPIIVNHCWYII